MAGINPGVKISIHLSTYIHTHAHGVSIKCIFVVFTPFAAIESINRKQALALFPSSAACPLV